MDQDGYKPTSGDEDVEGEGGIKSSNLEDFHPHEFYVACKYGPTVLGGPGEAYFLKDAQDMQDALAMALEAGTSFATTNARKKPMLLALRKKRPSATRYLSTRTTVLVRWAESAVLCASIHAPPAPSVSGYTFARTTLHTSGIHVVRRLKVV